MAGSESDITNMNLAMNPVMTRKEKPRDYNVGFELTEENLRRIYGVAITRMREATNLEETKLYIKYKVKYRDNLEIHDFLTIDQIISEPGNQEIQSLEIIIGRSQSELPQIVLKFIKPDRLGQTSIKSIASGENRDWVEITIDNSINSAIRSIKRSPFALILVKPFVLALTIVMLIIAFLYDGVSMYFYSNTNIQYHFLLLHPVSNIFVFFVILCLVIASIITGILCYPPYVFNWGNDGINWGKRRRIGNIILIPVILALLTGILVTIITK